MVTLKKIKLATALLLAVVVAGLVAALKGAMASAQKAKSALDNVKQGRKSESNVRQALDYVEEKKRREVFKPKEDRSDFEDKW